MRSRTAISMRRTNVAAILVAALAAIPAAQAQGSGAEQHPALQVKIVGQGAPVIMIPGLASSGTTWDGTVAHLSAHYRCFELTLAGFAGVPPIDQPLMATARDQIAEYIRENHLVRPVIVGHSLGGTLALDLAARNPDLVGPVIIVDALPFFAGAWFQVDSLAAAQPGITQMKTGMEAMSHDQWTSMTQSGASTNAMATKPEDQKTLIAWGLASDQKTVTSAMIDLVSQDLRPELKNIETPVLVIGTWVGLKDYGVTEEAVTQEFHNQYAGVKDLHFVMAEQARHFVMWDDPSWFYTQVDDFLTKSGGSSGTATTTANSGQQR
jgi:pimeloyl-ACP methyl ester carboxylesterase